jgi:hypothetical protein
MDGLSIRNQVEYSARGIPLRVLRPILLVVMLFPMLGFLNSWTSPAYTDDPARCSSYPGACDPEIAAALESFPYWGYRATTGAGTHFFLGTSGGYMWGITCNHCNRGAASWQLQDGQILDSVGFDDQPGSGVFRQLGNGDNPIVGSSHYGDYLYRFSPRPGETLPNMPFVRLLPSLDMLDDKALILTIGNGATGTHPTLGWFTECATTTEGGQPASGLPSCCTGERWADPNIDNYGPFGSNPYLPFASCSMPFGYTPVATPLLRPAPVCWGGEGDFETCTDAGLEYIGPVWNELPYWHWGTTRLWPVSSFSIENHAHGPYLKYQNLLRPARAIIPGETLVDQGLCIERQGQNDQLAPYHLRIPPVNRERSQMTCEYSPASSLSPDFMALTEIIGDSGSADFAFVDGVWYLLGSGEAPGRGSPLGFHDTYRASLASWIYENTQDQDGDDVHDFADNCTFVSNGDPLVEPLNQIDSDGDGFGNVCDGDFNQDGVVGGTDFGLFVSCVGSESSVCQALDMNGDGLVGGGGDFTEFVATFGQLAGPSGLACVDSTTQMIVAKSPGIPCP